MVKTSTVPLGKKVVMRCSCYNRKSHPGWTAVATPATLPERVIRKTGLNGGPKTKKGRKEEKEEEEESDEEEFLEYDSDCRNQIANALY